MPRTLTPERAVARAGGEIRKQARLIQNTLNPTYRRSRRGILQRSNTPPVSAAEWREVQKILGRIKRLAAETNALARECETEATS